MASWRHLTRAYEDPLEADPRSGTFWHRHDSITKQRRMFVKDPNYFVCHMSCVLFPLRSLYDPNIDIFLIQSVAIRR